MRAQANAMRRRKSRRQVAEQLKKGQSARIVQEFQIQALMALCGMKPPKAPVSGEFIEYPPARRSMWSRFKDWLDL